MSDRVFRRPSSLTGAPACDPYYQQLHLPRAAPGTSPAAIISADPRQRFHRFGSIVTPAANTTNTLITSYKVPDGHEAGVGGIVCFYSGSGFVEGDASLLYFSLRLNGAQYVSDYDVIPNTLGSLSSGPWPVIARIKLYAADLLEFLVTVPAGSTIATGGTTRAHAHLLGAYWPAQ